MSEASQNLLEISKTRGLTEADKRWFTKKIKEERRHELTIKAMEWFMRDPDAKYYVGAAAGLGVAAVGTMIGDFMGDIEDSLGIVVDPSAGPPKPKETGARLAKIKAEGGGSWWSWVENPVGSLSSDVMKGLGPKMGADFGSNLSDLMALGGGSFAAMCVSILIFKSIFSGTDLGELLSGVGALTPFT